MGDANPRGKRQRRKFLDAAAGELIEFAQHEFRLNHRDPKDGQSLREDLAILARFGRAKPEDMENPTEFPDVLYGLWQAFLRLNARRAPLPFGGVASISEQDIQAYCANRRTRFTEWELSALYRLDRVVLDIANERRQQEQDQRQDQGQKK